MGKLHEPGSYMCTLLQSCISYNSEEHCFLFFKVKAKVNVQKNQLSRGFNNVPCDWPVAYRRFLWVAKVASFRLVKLGESLKRYWMVIGSNKTNCALANHIRVGSACLLIHLTIDQRILKWRLVRPLIRKLGVWSCQRIKVLLSQLTGQHDLIDIFYKSRAVKSSRSIQNSILYSDKKKTLSCQHYSNSSRREVNQIKVCFHSLQANMILIDIL